MPAKNPEQRRVYETARRRSQSLKLRLTEEEAQRVRDAAAGAGKSLVGYLLASIDGQPRPVVDLADVAKLSAAVAALRAAPQAVRNLEADLGRLSGRLSHLFTMDYALASEHREEIHATLNEVRDLLRVMPEAVAALQAETTEPREEIVRVLRGVGAALNP
jgi:uncharacterized protein (DUF1778 family)